MSISLAPARAEASRRNGAASRGPKTADGKARSSRNALKHGLRAEKFVVVGDEKAADFATLEAALADELAPDGALQGLLAGRIARAAWRLERAERIEAELFARHCYDNGSLGLALIRDGHGSRAFDTLLRYRGTTLAELWRALRLLKALQAEAHARDAAPAPARRDIRIEPGTPRIPGEMAPAPPAGEADDASDPHGADQAEHGMFPRERAPAPALCEQPPARRGQPKEPEASANFGKIPAGPAADEPEADIPGRQGAALAVPDRAADRPVPCADPSASGENPNEPEARKSPGEIAPAAPADESVRGLADDDGGCGPAARLGSAGDRATPTAAPRAGDPGIAPVDARREQVLSGPDERRKSQRAAAAARCLR